MTRIVDGPVIVPTLVTVIVGGPVVVATFVAGVIAVDCECIWTSAVDLDCVSLLV